ncbi:acyl-CoA dehydrogenase family protein [Pseudonocardia halophobica]|uniref:acyl-CoA dehydrogenase family protein n=1 Tax=Pseudonocardia halophobica TaxID=29401 RepID=UPI003D8E723C
MDLTLSEQAERLRTEVRQFIATHVPQGWAGEGALDPADVPRFRQDWRAALVEAHLLAPHWPTEYGGRGLDALEYAVVVEEFVAAGVPQFPATNDGMGISLLGPAVLAWGTEEQKQRFLPATLRGDIRWAQGYSEPEAGSDLFALKTRADRFGDEFVLNGQKIWQTVGLTANWIFVLARTDPQARKSRGITFFVVELDQPGVEVRGIRNLNGEPEFCEVFFTDARTSAENVIGGVDNGAKVALTLLGHERGANGLSLALANRIELQRLATLIRESGLADDDEIRRRLGKLAADVELQRAFALWLLGETAGGSEVGPLSSIVKLRGSQHRQRVHELALDVLGTRMNDLRGAAGTENLRAEPLGTDPLSSRVWARDFLFTRAGTIYGGSEQIQKNTLGEQVLGLPREPAPTPQGA